MKSELTVQVMRREFRYNGKKFPDPNPKLSPESVRGFYGTQYPELVNAVLEGPVIEEGVKVYKFAARVGKNG